MADKKKKNCKDNNNCNDENVNINEDIHNCGCECEENKPCNDNDSKEHNKEDSKTDNGKITALENELAEAKEKFLRLAADFENFKKRSRIEKEAAYKNAVSDTVLTILPILDSIEYALKAETTDEPFKQGVEKILIQANKCFSDLNVISIGKQSEVFDPELHNAVAHCEDDSFETCVIAEVLQKGYKVGDKVIRHALVKVAN